MKSYQRNTHFPMSVAVVFTVEEIQNQLKCTLINEYMRKIYYTHNTVLFSFQEEWISVIFINMEGTVRYHK